MQPIFQPPLVAYDQQLFNPSLESLQNGAPQMASANLNYPQYGQTPQFEMQSMPDVISYNSEALTKMTIPEISEGYEKLEKTKGVHVKQQFNLIDELTGFEIPNVYKVFSVNPNNIHFGSEMIFKCQEISRCCMRCLCALDCYPFNMKVINEGILKNGMLHKSQFLHLERPFKLTWMCFNRPQMRVTFVENGTNKLIGKIKQPYYFCSIGVTIEDAAGNLKYRIEGKKCQIGYLCIGYTCDACSAVEFEVKNASGDIVTSLIKQMDSCMKNSIGYTMDFSLIFPDNSTPEEKTLLISAIIFLDYMYFEKKQTFLNRVIGCCKVLWSCI